MHGRILRAARAEFARHGLGGARVARIAESARANKERLYHYVGDKNALFDTVLEDALEQIGEAEPFVAEDLGAYVAAMADFHRRDPTLVGLLLAEARETGAGPLRRAPERSEHYARRVRAVRAAQARGALRDDVDPRIVVYAVLALVVAAEALPQMTGLILAGGEHDSALEARELRDGLGDLVKALLSQPSGTLPSRPT